MPRGVPSLINFNSGELSPLFNSRTDQDRYFTGCSRLENYLPQVLGPIIRRGGSRFVATSKNNGIAWLQEFIFSQAQSYILEFGDLYIRFYVNRGQLQSGMAAFEVVSPWGISDLTNDDGTFALHFEQSGDTLYITHSSGTFQPRKLQRLGATSWTLSLFEFKLGPFKDVDPNNTVTITPSALTGTGITLTASAATFNANHVGSLIFLQLTPAQNYKTWATGKSVAINEKTKYQGNYYQNLTSTATTETNPPTHIFGDIFDGQGGSPGKWRYLHSGYGIAKITAFTSSTVVTADVMSISGNPSRLPGDGATAEGTFAFTLWAFQDVSTAEGWPTTLGFYKERLIFMKNRTVYGSRPAGYEDFLQRTGPDITAADAFRLVVALKKIDQPRWIGETKDLIIGTDGFEFIISPETNQQVFSPQNIKSDTHTKIGSNKLQPIIVENSLLHVSASGTTLRELLYSYEIERYKSEDISVLSEHLAFKQIIDIAYQSGPNPVIWCVTKTNELLGITYNRARGVIGWAKYPIGGFSNSQKTLPAKVLSVACISSPDRKVDDVWIVVERFIDGGIKRYIEYIEDYRLVQTSLNDAFYIDSGLTYNGVPATTISGLDHLKGEVVQVFADGGVHPDRTVSGAGQITLQTAASIVHVGLKYTSKYKSMDIEFGAPDGAAQTRMRSLSELVIRFRNTIGGKVGPREDKLDPLKFTEAGLPLGVPTPLFNGDKRFEPSSMWKRAAFLLVEQDQPLPMTLVGLYPRVHVHD